MLKERKEKTFKNLVSSLNVVFISSESNQPINQFNQFRIYMSNS